MELVPPSFPFGVCHSRRVLKRAGGTEKRREMAESVKRTENPNKSRKHPSIKNRTIDEHKTSDQSIVPTEEQGASSS